MHCVVQRFDIRIRYGILPEVTTVQMRYAIWTHGCESNTVLSNFLYENCGTPSGVLIDYFYLSVCHRIEPFKSTGHDLPNVNVIKINRFFVNHTAPFLLMQKTKIEILVRSDVSLSNRVRYILFKKSIVDSIKSQYNLGLYAAWFTKPRLLLLAIEALQPAYISGASSDTWLWA